MTVTPSSLTFDPAPWEGLLAEAARRHHVPGIVAGVLHLDSQGTEQRFVAATGIANQRTGERSDRSTLCQIGSVTKLITSTMIMQLREEGRLDLDTRVIDLLPDFALSGSHATSITVQHLLTHTSGIDGDLFTDTGRGDDCVEKYVNTLTEAQSLFSPGNGWSYCNSGFVVAGRIIEVLDGTSWNDSLQLRICQRLGLEHFFTLAEDIMAHRHQTGHVRPPGGRDWVPAPQTQITRSMGPAGTITSSVDDLLSFGAAFLRGGRAMTGQDLLSSESVEKMTSVQHRLDPAAAAMAPNWGLGWMIDEWEKHPVVWHGGTTIGNNAWFQVLPEDGLVLVVFCNGGMAASAATEIYTAFAREFAAITPPQSPKPSGPVSDVNLDPGRLGRYEDASTTVELELSESGVARARASSRLGLGNEPESAFVDLHPTGAANQFLVRPDDLSAWAPLSFAEVDGRECMYLGIRCLPRTSAGESQ